MEDGPQLPLDPTRCITPLHKGIAADSLGGMTEYLTTADAARELGVSVMRVRQLIQRERLAATKFGHVYMIAPGDLAALVRRPPGRPRQAAGDSGLASSAVHHHHVPELPIGGTHCGPGDSLTGIDREVVEGEHIAMTKPGRVVIAVVGRKGGAGKTTTAFNLAGALAEKGQHVILLDLDPQESLSRLLTARDGMVRALGNVADQHVAFGDVAEWLRSMLPPKGYVVIDTPPYQGAIMDAAIAVADHVVVPTRLAQQDIDSLLDTLQRCPESALIVPNLFASRRLLHREAVAALRQRYGSGVSSREIPDSALIEESLNVGTPVVRFARRSAPALAYRALAAQVQS
jgi:chromosome partitioning protein